MELIWIIETNSPLKKVFFHKICGIEMAILCVNYRCCKPVTLDVPFLNFSTGVLKDYSNI
jgi:hypothetical protein